LLLAQPSRAAFSSYLPLRRRTKVPRAG
jgi:hypothetical protein